MLTALALALSLSAGNEIMKKKVKSIEIVNAHRRRCQVELACDVHLSSALST